MRTLAISCRTLLALFLVTVPGTVAAQTVIPPGYELTSITDDFLGPVSLGFLPDGRTLVVERYNGLLRMIKDDVALTRPVADFATNMCRERGLLGVAVDPDFANTGWVYVFYSRSSLPGLDTLVDSLIVDNRIVRITLDGDTMLAGSEVLIRSLPTDPKSCLHVGGNIHFRADGSLLVSSGDMQADVVPSLDLASLHGKLLRLDPATGQAAADNFFALDGDPNTLPEIWSYGLRNSFDFTIDRSTGQVYGSENSNFFDDEVNLLEERRDYGWPIVVGPADTPDEDAYAAAHPDYRDPLWSSGPITVCPTGIVAIDPERWDGDFGKYLLVAECNPPYRIRRLPLDPTGTFATGPQDDLVTDFPGPVIDIEFDAQDRLWITTFNEVYRLRRLPTTNDGGPAHPDGLALSYAGAHPARGGVSLDWSSPGTERVRLSVHDLAGRTIRLLVDGPAVSGRANWDGRDDGGAAVGAGVYFARLSRAGVTRSLPIVLLD